MLASRGVLGLLLVSAFATTACMTYRDQLGRGQRAFELNEHDRTLAILRDLEPDVNRLSMHEQAEYAYLRGMTDYRVGYKSDARHWLSVAKAYEDHSPGVLPADWKARANEALDELNDVVYSAGTSALPTSRTDDDGTKPESRKDGTTDLRDAKKERKNVPSDPVAQPPESANPLEPATSTPSLK